MELLCLILIFNNLLGKLVLRLWLSLRFVWMPLLPLFPFPPFSLHNVRVSMVDSANFILFQADGDLTYPVVFDVLNGKEILLKGDRTAASPS